MFNRFRKDRITSRENGLFGRKYKGLDILSPAQNILKSTFNNIFIKEIYNFDTTDGTPYIIDGGANIGLAAIFFKHKFPNAEILCFEPSIKVFEILKTNIQNNQFQNIQLINKALYSKVTTLDFTSNEGLAGSLIKEKKLQNNYQVKTDILSKYLTKKVDLLKLDIEGAEVEVIKECEHLLYNAKRIFIEYHSFEHKTQELSILLSILEKNDFRYHLSTDYSLDSPFLGFKKSLGQDFQINIWAVRK